MKWDDGLEGLVKEIVESNDKTICIQAGPGTGKSFIMERRIMRFLQEGVDPKSILACTFTNVAANDLQKTVLGTKMPEARLVNVGTIHSFCFKVLQSNSVFTFFHRNPRPLSDFEIEFLLEDLKGNPFGDKRSIRKLVRRFETAWATRLDEEPGWPNHPVEKKFHNAVIDWLSLHEAMLIGELVPFTLNFLRQNPYATEVSQFQFVFVDEYQDLNKSEQELIRLISKNANLMIVGDPNQSLYSFKGGHPEGIINFEIDNQNVTTYPLNVCRRCPKQIVRMAKELISKNDNHSRTALEEFESNQEGNVQTLQWRTNEEESSGIAELINHFIDFGIASPGEIIVISPVTTLANELSKELKKQDIKFRNHFSNIYKLNPSKNDQNQPLVALSTLKLLNNPNDFISLRCLFGYGKAGLSNEAWRFVITKSKELKINPKEVLDLINSDKVIIQKQSSIKRTYNVILENIDHLSNLSIPELFDELFPTSEGWTEPFHEAVKGFDLSTATLGKLNEHLSAFFDVRELPANVDYVRIMSPHKAKGLTVPVTIVIGLVEGLMPNNFDRNIVNEDESKPEDEEKRRLFYVAITRSETTLILSNFKWLKVDIANHYNVKSRGYDNSYVYTYGSSYLTECGMHAPYAKTGEEYLAELKQA